MKVIKSASILAMIDKKDFLQVTSDHTGHFPIPVFSVTHFDFPVYDYCVSMLLKVIRCSVGILSFI